MKYFLFVIAIILSIFTSNPATHTEISMMEEMYELVDQRNLNLVNWQITIRESISIDDITSFIEKQTGKDFYISERANEKIKLNRQKNSRLNENLLLVSKNNGSRYEVIYSVSAEDFNQEIKKVAEKYIKTVENDIFSTDAQKFSCIYTNFDGIIEISEFKEFAKNRLNLETIDETREDKFWTWTAHHPNWDNGINTRDDERMNIQIAVKHTENEQSNVIIGTPILISEY